MIPRSNPGRIASIVTCSASLVVATLIWTATAGAHDFGRQVASQVQAGLVSQIHYTGKKHRHTTRKRTRQANARAGRHLYPYPYYPPCPYYFPAYGTYPCVAQGYYPDPPYSYGFGFGGPFWGGGNFDHD